MTEIAERAGVADAENDVTAAIERTQTDDLAKPERRIRKAAMRPRRSIVRVHRWLSIALMGWLVVISLTGAWLVVNDAVSSWTHSERYETTDGDVGIQAAADAALDAAGPGSIVEGAQTPRNSRGVYKIGMAVPNGEGQTIAADEEPELVSLVYFVDPGSGRVNGVANEAEGATPWIYRGHIYLWQDHGLFGVFDENSGWCKRNDAGAEPGGVKGIVCDVIPEGDDMVAWFAVGWIVVLLSGFYLWYWPGVRRWATALVIKRRRGAFALNMSVHKLIGLVVWAPLTIVAFTGVAFAFPKIGTWYDDLTPAQSEFDLWSGPEVTSASANGRQSMTIGEIEGILVASYPDRAVEGIYPPADETGTYTAWMTRGFSPWTREDSGGNVYMVLDQYSGTTLYDGTPGEGNVFDQIWDDYSFPLHAGDVAGAVSRVAWVVAGLSPLVLGITGIVMNRIRSRKRARRRPSGTESVEDVVDADVDAGQNSGADVSGRVDGAGVVAT